MGCTVVSLKIIVFILVFSCGIFSVLEIGASSYALHENEPNDAVRGPCIAGIVLGSVLFLISIFSYWIVFSRSVRAIWIGVSLWIILTIAQLTVFFVVPVDYHAVTVLMVNSTWDAQLTDNSSFTALEEQYLCCGKTGPNDYADSGLPLSENCIKAQNDTLIISCTKRVDQTYEHFGEIETIADWTLISVEVATIIALVLLGITSKNEERRQPYR